MNPPEVYERVQLISEHGRVSARERIADLLEHI